MFNQYLKYISCSFYRSKKENILVVDVTPGPFKPAYIFSYLYPIVEELLVLESKGMNIYNRRTSQNLHVKASLYITIGDIPGVAELCMHKGHQSYYGCRICPIRGTDKKFGKAIYFLPVTASESIEVRKRQDFSCADGVSTVYRMLCTIYLINLLTYIFIVYVALVSWY